MEDSIKPHRIPKRIYGVNYPHPNIKEIIRAWGMNPEQLLSRDALSDGAITHKNHTDLEKPPAS